MVSAKEDGMTAVLKMVYLLQDAYVRAVIGEK
jgi:hypothetical protein